MSNTPSLNGQIPPHALLAVILILAAIGRLDPETLAAVGTAAEVTILLGLTHGPRTGP